MTTAKDTVLSQKEVKEIISQRMPELIEATVLGEEYPAMWHKELQAEATWPVAKLEGIREAAEWISENSTIGNKYWNTLMYEALIINTEKWQAKLKEWGIKWPHSS